MDAKSKANFINSVAGGQGIPCQACNSLNKSDAVFCAFCGEKLNPAFASVRGPEAAGHMQEKANESAEQPVSVSAKSAFQEVAWTVIDEPEEVSAFAQGLPSWDIIPPQVMVRRKNRR